MSFTFEGKFRVRNDFFKGAGGSLLRVAFVPDYILVTA